MGEGEGNERTVRKKKKQRGIVSVSLITFELEMQFKTTNIHDEILKLSRTSYGGRVKTRENDF